MFSDGQTCLISQGGDATASPKFVGTPTTYAHTVSPGATEFVAIIHVGSDKFLKSQSR